MKILFLLETPMAWQSGIWLHRSNIPGNALAKRGHAIKHIAITNNMPEEHLAWPDVVIFGRTYPNGTDPVGLMREYKKRGKRLLYDIDDDLWSVSKDNPSHLVSNALKDQYEGMIELADAIITPSKVLAKKIKKHFKKEIFICPNGIDDRMYRPRPVRNEEIVIGYMGAASHWKDLQIIADVVDKLSEKYDFIFRIYGLTGDSMEAAMYTYRRLLEMNAKPENNEYFKAALKFHESLKRVKVQHIPFMPPELHPAVLSNCDITIGLAPLEDTEFNSGKSCIKYYEYASTGTVCLASDVEPYKSECSYLAKNNFKDWYNKLERLITDNDFRNKLGKEQTEWVMKNRSVDAIGLPWELACQRPGGLKVLNQQDETSNS